MIMLTERVQVPLVLVVPRPSHEEKFYGLVILNYMHGSTQYMMKAYRASHVERKQFKVNSYLVVGEREDHDQ